MRTISSRLVMMVGSAAVAPLLLYGGISYVSLRASTQETAITGNRNVALQAAAQVRSYVSTSTDILKAVASDLSGTGLERWQQERILRNYVLAFPEFREITAFDADGAPTVSSAIAGAMTALPSGDLTEIDTVALAPVVIDDDLLPTTTAIVRIAQLEGGSTWLAAEFDLMEIWRMVDGIRVGANGVALLVAAHGRLIAHGNPEEQRRIALGEHLIEHPLVRPAGAPTAAPDATETIRADGTEVLSVAAPVEPLGWTLIVEQPTAEAYAAAYSFGRRLLIAIVLALALMVVVGFAWGRTFLKPIAALMGGTRAIADGRLDQRVQIDTRDEFRMLGDSFNQMVDRVVELQKDVRRQERQAIFGRIAAGLVHDLAHPIQNIGNSCKLILKMSDDADYRATFKRTVDREFGAIRRVLEGLRNLARPIPMERFTIDVNRSVTEVVESMEQQAKVAGVTLETRLTPQRPRIEGDLFALSRVYRNLITNALQATPPHGRLTIETSTDGDRVTLRFVDTGCGIPAEKLTDIFEDFATTKRRGLGLGLAVCKKIVGQLSGTIEVASRVGHGTTFTLSFPALAGTTPQDTPPSRPRTEADPVGARD